MTDWDKVRRVLPPRMLSQDRINPYVRVVEAHVALDRLEQRDVDIRHALGLHNNPPKGIAGSETLSYIHSLYEGGA